MQKARKLRDTGGHRASVDYAEGELAGILDPEVLQHLDQMRTVRNRTQYGGRGVGKQELEHDLEIARIVVRRITDALL